MKVYFEAHEGDGRDTLIEGICPSPEPEEVYVLWKVDRQIKGKCYLYVEINGVLQLIRAGTLHEKTFEDYIIDRFSIPNMPRWREGDDQC